MGTFLQRYTACPRYFALFHFFVCSLGAQQQYYQCMAFYQTVKAKHRPRCKRLTHNSCVIVHIWPESKPGRQKSNTRVRLCTIILQHKDRKFRISHWFIIYDFDCVYYTVVRPSLWMTKMAGCVYQLAMVHVGLFMYLNFICSAFQEPLNSARYKNVDVKRIWTGACIRLSWCSFVMLAWLASELSTSIGAT